VFTKPEGGLANLKFMADQLGIEGLEGKLRVEVFDRTGRKHIARSKDEALTVLALLRGQI